jgi:hypothetical protein
MGQSKGKEISLTIVQEVTPGKEHTKLKVPGSWLSMMEIL